MSQTPNITAPDGLREGEETQESDTDVLSYDKERRKMSFSEDRWLYWVRVGFLLFSSCATLAIVSVYMWHLVSPEKWRWLLDTEISKLKDLAITIIVGLLMSATTTYFFRKNGK